jgi:23S rRNA (cytosine1962-C5)-methyltransferase
MARSGTADGGARTARVSRRGASRWVDRQHPWIYRSDVLEPPSGAGSEAGAVRVIDERGAPIGMALWSPSSQISLRLLTRHEQPIDGGFWRERIGGAAAYRRALTPDGDAYRLVHGEGDGLPSLVVDRYGDHLVVQLLSAGLEAFRAEIVAALVDEFAPAGILARNDAAIRRHESLPQEVLLLHGAVPEELTVREGRISYLAAPWSGQKTGAFLDQRENRARAGALARGRGLDCFAYHGSFALHLATQADEVVVVDSSGPALARAQENAALNGFSSGDGGHSMRHAERGTVLSFREANAFDLLRELESAGERFDIIALDPPAFAKRRDAVHAALRGYKELNLRALRLLAPGGHLCTFSCSFHLGAGLFREMLESAAADSRRPVRWIEWRGQAPDHPELIGVPESSYLKGAVLQAV